MRLPRPRFTLRQMLIAVAVVAVLMIPLAEESHRRYLVTYHARQEALIQQKAAELHQKGLAALKAGRKQEAADFFRSYNYWNYRAQGHQAMQQL
jgi:Tfp pilus assembly protein PilV